MRKIKNGIVILSLVFISLLSGIMIVRASVLEVDFDIEYGTYLGGSLEDRGNSIAIDSSGAMYITGVTWSTDFPTQNEIDAVLSGDSDAFVTKLDENGELVYSTYIGGFNDEEGLSIAVDANDCCYITGNTNSPDFPTVNAIMPTFSEDIDVFVTKLNPDGSLNYSTYLGGGAFDYGGGIAVDSDGMCYITGSTESADFPTYDAYDDTLNSGDVFITILNPDGTLHFSSFLGGDYWDMGHDITIDNVGDFYITGEASLDFPMVNAWNDTFGGYEDAFITKFDFLEKNISYSTYIGGNDGECGNSIAVDENRAAYITGWTTSTTFPTTSNAFDNAYDDDGDGNPNTGTFDSFMTKLDPSGNLSYSTYLGGINGENGYGIAVDAQEYCYVTGFTYGDDFPMLHAMDDSSLGGGGFITIFNPSGDLHYSSLLGGAYEDHSNDIVLGDFGEMYFTGMTKSTNFPMENGFDQIFNNNGLISSQSDGFVTKITNNGRKIPGYRLEVIIPILGISVAIICYRMARKHKK